MVSPPPLPAPPPSVQGVGALVALRTEGRRPPRPGQPDRRRCRWRQWPARRGGRCQRQADRGAQVGKVTGVTKRRDRGRRSRSSWPHPYPCTGGKCPADVGVGSIATARILLQTGVAVVVEEVVLAFFRVRRADEHVRVGEVLGVDREHFRDSAMSVSGLASWLPLPS